MNPSVNRARCRATIALILSVFASATVAAQATSAPLVLDLKVTIERALAASPRLAAARDALLVSDARLRAAYSQYYPSAVGSAAYVHASPVEPGSLSIDLGGALGTKTVLLDAPLQDSVN
ncbi:MAG: hypothetical protein E4H20_06920, partial [Spirochaetales bacterium]